MTKYHDPSNMHVCDRCSCRFKDEVGVANHRRQCGGTNEATWKQFPCECGRAFSSKGFLNKHLKKTCEARPNVEVNLPHQCDECSDRFRTTHALAIHIGRDHGPKRYECPRCGAKHSNKVLHVRHVGRCERATEETTVYGCFKCGLRETSRELLDRHQATCDVKVMDEDVAAKEEASSLPTQTVYADQRLVAAAPGGHSFADQDAITGAATTTWIINPTEYVQTATGQEIIVQPAYFQQQR